MSGDSVDYNREHGGPKGTDPDGVIKSNWNEIVDYSDDVNVKESLLSGSYGYGFEKPSAISKELLFLVSKIQKAILVLGDCMGAACHACIGGTNVRNEMQKVQAEAPHIVVGTPGTVFD